MAAFSIFKKKPIQKKPIEKKRIEEKPAKKTQPSAVSPEVQKSVAAPSLLNGGEEENLILHPHFSEKTTAMEKERKYIFSVTPQAKKIEIKKAIENIYKVKVIKINILKSFTRSKRWGWKKTNFQKEKNAIVTLKEGQKIELGI